MRILLLLLVFLPVSVFGNDVKNCRDLLEPVFTKQAPYALKIEQHGGSCYFEAAVGMIQDDLIKMQMGCLASSDSYLYLARPTLMALNLLSRIRRIEQGENIDIIDIGSPSDLFELLEGLDIPLVQSSSLQPFNVSHMVNEVFQLYTDLSEKELEQGLGVASAKAYLQHQVDKEFKSAHKFFRIKEIGTEIYYKENDAIKTWPEELLFKDIINRHSNSLLVAITIPGGIHILRMVGYQEYQSGGIANVILENTAPDFKHPYKYGPITMPYSEFRWRCVEIGEILVNGVIIDKSEARKIIL